MADAAADLGKEARKLRIKYENLIDQSRSRPADVIAPEPNTSEAPAYPSCPQADADA